MKTLKKFAIPIFLAMSILLTLALVSCKSDCEHEFEWLTTPPTCTEEGVALGTCQKCGETERVTSKPLGHSGSGMACDACGMPVVSLTSLFPELGDISSLGVIVKDVYLPDDYSSTSIELAELVVYSDENGIGGYFNCEILSIYHEYDEQAVLTAYGFIEGESLYLAMASDYGSGTNERYSVYPLASILAANPQIGQALEMAETALPALETWLNESFLPCFGEINSEDSELTEENAVKAAAKILGLFFKVQATDDGYAIVLDLSTVKDINNTLNTKTVAEVVDILGGTGRFENLEKLIPTMLDYSVADLVEFVSVNLGVDITRLLGSLDELAVSITGYPEATFEMLLGIEGLDDIQALLNDEEFLATNVRDFLMMSLETPDAEALDTQIAEIVNLLKTVTPYQLLGVDEDTAAEISEAIDAASDMLSYEITVGKDGKFVGSVLSLTAEDKDLYLTVTLTPEKLSVSANDGIEDGNNIEIEIIPDYEPKPDVEKLAAIKATINLVPEISEEALANLDYIEAYTPVYEGEELVGVVLLDSYYYSEDEETGPYLTITAILIDFKALPVTVSAGCSSKIQISYSAFYSLYEERTYAVDPELISDDYDESHELALALFQSSDDYVIDDFYNDSYYLTVYYNTASGEYVDHSGHDYEIDEEHSIEATECGQSGKNVYVCTACGDINEYEYTVEHDIESATKSYTFDEENNAHVCAFICKCGEAIQVVTVHIEGDIAIAYRETANTSNDAMELSFAITSAGEYTLSIDSATNDGYAHIYSGTGCIGTFYFYADEDSEFTGSFGSTNNYMSLRFYDIEAENGITISVSPA
ncbi:MAG: hypothetical protein IKV43_01900 [Clostridia bacterium]|nr:hypothetical protein [Clostridia bacterium]